MKDWYDMDQCKHVPKGFIPFILQLIDLLLFKENYVILFNNLKHIYLHLLLLNKFLLLVPVTVPVIAYVITARSQLSLTSLSTFSLF